MNGFASPSDTRDFLLWISEGDRHDAVMLLEQLEFPGTDALAMTLARQLRSHRPTAIKRELAPVEALALAVVLLNGEVVDPALAPSEVSGFSPAADVLMNTSVRGVYETRQAAAFAAIRQVGGAAAFGVPADVEAELGDASRTADPRTVAEAEEIGEANHGWSIRHVLRLGFLLYRTNEH